MIDRLTRSRSFAPELVEPAESVASQRKRVLDPTISMDEVSVLARSTHAEIQRLAASHEHLNPVILSELVADGNLNVLEGCAASPHIALLPPALFRRLLECGRASIPLAANPNLPPTALASILARPNQGRSVWLLGAAYTNPAMTAAQIDHQSLREDLLAWQFVALAKNPSAPGPIRADLYQHGEEAPGDPAFDLQTETGHPGWSVDDDPATVYASLCETEDGATHPLGMVRAVALRDALRSNAATPQTIELLLRAANDDASAHVRAAANEYRLLGSDPSAVTNGGPIARPASQVRVASLADARNVMESEDTASWLATQTTRNKRQRRAILAGSLVTLIALFLGVRTFGNRNVDQPQVPKSPVTTLPGGYIPINDAT